MEFLTGEMPGIVKFLAYFTASVLMTALFIFAYAKVTPYREFALIEAGNTAAACSLSGAIIGFVIPLASAIIHSVSFPDMVLWGIVACVVQLVVFGAVRMIFRKLSDEIRSNDAAVGIFLGALSIAAGILNAACMSY